ncbi:hypothetical protein HMPREF9440_00554 [Sutterella parvirubra YIT 11816]|uniref:Uncharacterized protein n=1 Tax=Sutterella parvirubra YIT 11816 TaxID=762967 RepID=H3KCV1_9BURK|nr:hypothetical protein HMPREF9440_00554 [Sutterella parvirubra YIT 11816]
MHDAWDRIRGEEPEEPKNRLGRISSAGPRIVPRRRPTVAPRSATSPVRRASAHSPHRSEPHPPLLMNVPRQ